MVASYGTHPDKPIIEGDYSKWGGILIEGSFIEVHDITIKGWKAGILLSETSNSNLVSWNYVTKNRIGISVEGFNQTISYNVVGNNDIMMSDTLGTDDDYGAQGILLSSNASEIKYNAIYNNIALSADYGTDGSAIEIYGAYNNVIHHNVAINNDVFTELGHESTITNYKFNNSYFKNVGYNNYGTPVAVIHGQSNYGPVHQTNIYNNIFFKTKEPEEYYGPIIDIVDPENPLPVEGYFKFIYNLVFSTYHPIGNYENTKDYLLLFDPNKRDFVNNTIYYKPGLAEISSERQDLFLKNNTYGETNTLNTIDSLDTYVEPIATLIDYFLFESGFYDYFLTYSNFEK